jgi:energy-coupling factor transporter ATP-binding protein EcfA2
LSRAAHGLSVLITGPDGAGKSTLARHLVRELAPEFRTTVLVHWRPYVLPPLRALLPAASRSDDVARPHEGPPRGPILSFFLLTYHWLDFFLAGWLRFRRVRAQGGLVVVERGWWDLAVDPRRYRLRLARGVVLTLGRLLPTPDLVLVLDGDAMVVAARKRELPPGEVARQGAAWRALSVGRRRVALDASAPAQAVRRQAAATVRQALAEQREALDPGWAALPGGARASSSYPAFTGRKGEPRWWLPRGSRAVARASLLLYHPVTAKGMLAREASSLLARGVGFRLLPRCSPPPAALRRAVRTTLREALESSGVPVELDGGAFAAAKCNWPGRFVVLVCTARGTPVAVAKVALNDAGKPALEREAANLKRLGHLLPHPLSAPRLCATADGVLALAPERPRRRRHPGRMPEDVAFAFGRFFRAGVQANGPLLGLAHGDASPWNLLRTDRGWVLLDWEHADEAAPPFHDLFHFVVHAHSLMGRPAAREILDGLDGRGWVAAAIAAYARGAELPVETARRYLISYLETSLDENSELVDAVTERGRAAYEARMRLLLELGS